ncbi:MULTISPECIES: hypothetical protein [unclassified Anaeromyxobacter]|uniref:hypothetical protein n=1 Tax=unclassified Anaeromyxobacter TaxID=2620896 RepID=UPI001F59B9A2|nr:MULTISPECIES: hypothetical protein [unclassified Anaeromyxobacter]
MHTKRRACEPRWDSFTGWSSNRVKKPRAPSWRGTLEWIEAVRSAATAEYEELLPQIAVWDAALADLGGDPCRQAWAAFRPLRLSREEDWSDWLAYLLGTDKVMAMAARLFGPDGDSAPKVVEVQREVPVAGGERRADLVLLWTSNRASHVEVKLWDTCYEKTAETAAACRLEFKRGTGWRDYVLLPDEMEKVWAESPGTDGMRVVTWSSVAVQLRRALRQARLPGQWRAFARAYCGAIEQRILGIPPLAVFKMRRAPAAIFRFGRILREAADGQ